MLRKFQKKAGFVSIETLIVAGLMIALGAYAISEFYNVSNMNTDRAMNRVNQAMFVNPDDY